MKAECATVGVRGSTPAGRAGDPRSWEGTMQRTTATGVFATAILTVLGSAGAALASDGWHLEHAVTHRGQGLGLGLRLLRRQGTTTSSSAIARRACRSTIPKTHEGRQGDRRDRRGQFQRRGPHPRPRSRPVQQRERHPHPVQAVDARGAGPDQGRRGPRHQPLRPRQQDARASTWAPGKDGTDLVMLDSRR